MKRMWTIIVGFVFGGGGGVSIVESSDLGCLSTRAIFPEQERLIRDVREQRKLIVSKWKPFPWRENLSSE